MHVQYSETTTSGLTTATDPAVIEALHDLAAALAVWQEQAAAEDVDIDAMADAGDAVFEKLAAATNAAIVCEAMRLGSR